MEFIKPLFPLIYPLSDPLQSPVGLRGDSVMQGDVEIIFPAHSRELQWS